MKDAIAGSGQAVSRRTGLYSVGLGCRVLVNKLHGRRAQKTDPNRSEMSSWLKTRIEVQTRGWDCTVELERTLSECVSEDKSSDRRETTSNAM